MLCCCFVLSPRRERYRRQETRDRKLERQKKKLYCIDFSDNKSDSDNSYELFELRERGVEKEEKKELLVDPNNRLNERLNKRLDDRRIEGLNERSIKREKTISPSS